MTNNMMFYILENYQIGNDELLKKGVRDIADKGFNSILLQIRDTAFQMDDPEVVKSVEAVTDETHNLGLKICLAFITTDCRPWHYSFFKKYPQAGEVHILRGEGKIEGNKFSLPIFFSHDKNEHGAYSIRFEKVIKSFIKNEGEFAALPEFPYRIDIVRQAGLDEDGYFHGESKSRVVISGESSGIKDTTLILYGAFRVGYPDYASDEFRNFMNYLLDKYSHIPIDGVAWDEPGIPGDWSYYKISPAFCRRFTAEHGYDIINKLYMLDYEVKGCGKARYDYYLTLRNVLFDAQKHFVDKAREIFGRDIASGIHHTWTGEGCSNDLTAGCIDYFYLAKNLTGGFTDGGFSDEPALIYTYQLARSLGKTSRSQEAYSNCWDFCPTPEKIRFFIRLMAMWNLNWIGHAYGHGVGFGPGYPFHYTWEEFKQATKRLKEVKKFIGTAKSSPGIAIYHSWESLAGINTPFTHLHKTGLINLTYQLVKENIPFDFIGAEQLSGAMLKEEKMLLSDSRYELLIVPWSSMLPAAVWKKIKDFSLAGGKLIFFGPPAGELTAGENIMPEFFEMTGIESFSLAEYIDRYLQERGEPATRLPETDFRYPLKINGAREVVAKDGDCYGVRHSQRPTYYLSLLDPKEEILDIVKGLRLLSLVKINIKDVFYEIYRSDDEIVFVVTGSYDRSFSGSFSVGDHTIEVSEAKFLGVKIYDKGRVEVVGEGVKGSVIVDKVKIENVTEWEDAK